MHAHKLRWDKNTVNPSTRKVKTHHSEKAHRGARAWHNKDNYREILRRVRKYHRIFHIGSGRSNSRQQATPMKCLHKQRERERERGRASIWWLTHFRSRGGYHQLILSQSCCLTGWNFLAYYWMMCLQVPMCLQVLYWIGGALASSALRVCLNLPLVFPGCMRHGRRFVYGLIRDFWNLPSNCSMHCHMRSAVRLYQYGCDSTNQIWE